MADPKYVRLANRLSRGILADVDGSGWKISGLDVKPFPAENEPGATRFVKAALREGKLEPSSRAEFDEVQESHSAVESVSHQESKVQRAAMQAHRDLAESRGLDDDEDDDDEEDPRFAEADETEDPEEQVARNGQRTLPKDKKSAKAKKKGSKKNAEDAPSE